MYNKIIVKRGQRKGPRDFTNIVSALVPGANPQGAMFLVFSAVPLLIHQAFWLFFIIEE